MDRECYETIVNFLNLEETMEEKIRSEVLGFLDSRAKLMGDDYWLVYVGFPKEERDDVLDKIRYLRRIFGLNRINVTIEVHQDSDRFSRKFGHSIQDVFTNPNVLFAEPSTSYAASLNKGLMQDINSHNKEIERKIANQEKRKAKVKAAKRTIKDNT